MSKKRGRPPKYDTEKVLEAAMVLFWQKGFAGTSLDDLAAVMEMNRPSIYNAFGDKEAIYRKAMFRFANKMGSRIDEALFKEPEIKTALKQFYSNALDIYLSEYSATGCFVTCTAPVEAASNETIRKDLQRTFQNIDLLLEKRLEKAKKDGQVPEELQVNLASKVLQATLQTIALRARAGEDRASLEKLYSYSIELLF